MKKDQELVIEEYQVTARDFPARVQIVKGAGFTLEYRIKTPDIGEATKAVLDSIKLKLIRETKIEMHEILDPRIALKLEARFKENALKIVNEELPGVSDSEKKMLAGLLVNEMFGLGNIEIPLNDNSLEEVVINNSVDPVWVYHKKYGWLKTNIYLPSEDKIVDYANFIGRRVGRQVTVLDPLMDAHLITGDRVNATLFPISTDGNTITIRKFARKPWTITDFISINTMNEDIAALIWTCVQYELNVLISGGTGSGKTSTLNAITPFIQPNNRVISIEDTRELSLPPYLHWIPLTTREPNPEGKGEVSMLDLMVNSLRMRPDRMLVGEIRRQREAEVLFEAMHTGHSVYSTLHADRAEQVKRRLITPPINIPESLLEALHLVVVQYRQRKIGIRRTLEVAEVVPTGETEEKAGIMLRQLYRWRPRQDDFVKEKESIRLWEEIGLLTGMTERELDEDLAEKRQILRWMVDKKINDLKDVGLVMATYYKDKNELLELVNSNKGISGLK